MKLFAVVFAALLASTQAIDLTNVNASTAFKHPTSAHRRLSSNWCTIQSAKALCNLWIWCAWDDGKCHSAIAASDNTTRSLRTADEAPAAQGTDLSIHQQ